jgi:hypothetical protein
MWVADKKESKRSGVLQPFKHRQALIGGATGINHVLRRAAYSGCPASPKAKK